MVKEIKLNRGCVTIVDDEEYEQLSKYRWYVLSIKMPYVVTNYRENGKTINVRMQRLIINAPKGLEVDHINGDTFDNRKVNLRLCTSSQNKMNKSKKLGLSSSIYKGVSWHKGEGKWRSYIKRDKKVICLGYYRDEKKAALAYNEAAKELHGQFCRLNIL